MSVFEGVKTILVEQGKLEPKDVTPEAKFVDDLGFDSLGFVEVLFAVQEEYKVKIPDEDAEKFRTGNV